MDGTGKEDGEILRFGGKSGKWEAAGRRYERMKRTIGRTTRMRCAKGTVAADGCEWI